MKNTVPRTNEGLAALAGDVANGLAQHETTLEILQNTQNKVRGDITAYDTAHDAFKAAIETESDQRDALRAVVVSAIAALTVGRDNLKPFLGRSYNQAWDVTGLTRSLMMPRSAEKVQRLLRSFKVYFAANPPHEVAAKEVTAAAYQTLLEDMDSARATLALHASERVKARQTRDEKAAQLRKRLRDTIKELSMKLGPLDSRWKAFGLNMPGAVETPDVPTNVTAVLIGATAVAVQWDAAPRAEHYRVWKKVTGVDEEFVAAGSAEDTDFTIEPLPANAAVDIAVSAVNSGGESQRSAVVTVVTH